MFFRYSKYQLNKMSGQPPPQQQQKIDDDYELWDPRNREDTRIGKGFVVNIAVFLLNMNHKIMASHFSVCWCFSGSRSCWIYGKKLQEQHLQNVPSANSVLEEVRTCWTCLCCDFSAGGPRSGTVCTFGAEQQSFGWC